MRTRDSVLTAALALFALAHPALPQAGPGTLRGQVTDPAGASVPGAQVSLAGAGGGWRSAATDVRGEYQFGNIAPGVYTVRVSAKGFAPAERTGYEVKSGSQALDFPLA